jgi:hypothetical protein
MDKKVLTLWFMSACCLLSMVMVPAALATHMPTPPDTNIRMSINGTEVVSSPCTTSICTVNIASTYTVGGVTVTIAKLTTGSANPARIESDNSMDLLRMRNVKITTNTANTVTIRFWRKFPATGIGGTVNWYYEARGGGKLLKNTNLGAPNAKILFRGYVETPSGSTNTTLGSLVPPPVTCPPSDQPKLNFCVPGGNPSSAQATFNWGSGYFRTTTYFANLNRNQDRILTGYIELTLPSMANGDSLQMADTVTAGLQIQGNSSPGQGPADACETCTGEECATCANCPGSGPSQICKPKREVNAFCMTSFSSSTGPTSSTECPDCITADGQVAQSAKVPLFAKSNLDNLLEDMARGHGEHLASLASLLGVPREQYPAFFVIAQDEYSSLSLYDRVPAPEAVIAGLRERWATQSGLVSLAVRPAN